MCVVCVCVCMCAYECVCMRACACVEREREGYVHVLARGLCIGLEHYASIIIGIEKHTGIMLEY